MKETYTETAPLRVLVGWAEGISKNDAVDLAKGFIQRRFEAIDASWYAIAPFSGGYLWEVHEGGQGKAYMPAVIDALSQDPGGVHWFPSRDRAFQVMMRDGKPFCILLSASDSKAIIASERAPLLPSGKMVRAVKKGTAMLATGGAMFGTGFSFLLGSMVFFGLAGTPGPAVRDIKFENLPLAQWPKVADTATTEIVTKLEFADGKWSVEKRHHEIKEPEQPAPTPPAPDGPVQTEAPQERQPPATPADGSEQAPPPPPAASPAPVTAPEQAGGEPRPTDPSEPSGPRPAPHESTLPADGPVQLGAPDGAEPPPPSGKESAPAADAQQPAAPPSLAPAAIGEEKPASETGRRQRPERRPRGAPRPEQGEASPDASSRRKEPKPLVQAKGAER